MRSHIDESSDEHSTSAALFCQSSCFCSAASHAASGITTSKSTSTENPVSSYSKLDTSASDSSSRADITECSNESTANNVTTVTVNHESKVHPDTVVDSCNSRVNLDTVIAVDASSECTMDSANSRVASEITITLESDESSEEFFTDAAIDKRDEHDNVCHRKHAVICDAMGLSVSLVRKSSSTSELMAGIYGR